MGIVEQLTQHAFACGRCASAQQTQRAHPPCIAPRVRTVAIAQQPALHPEHVVASVSMARASLATSFGSARSMRVTLRFWRAHWNPTFVLLRAHGVANSVAHWETARSRVRLWHAFHAQSEVLPAICRW
jgi:hypothetical protein